MTNIKQYKGILHIGLEITADEFSIDDEQKAWMAGDIDRFVEHNAGGIQEDGSFDIDCESPRISLEGTLKSVERIKDIICEHDPNLKRDKLDISVWIHIPKFYSEANAKPGISTSVEHPKGVPCTIRDWTGELLSDHLYFGEHPSPVTTAEGMDDLERVAVDQIDFI